MALASVAPEDSAHGDPDLDAVISEIESEGEAGTDPASDSGASQVDDTSGATQSDPSSATGDGASGQAEGTEAKPTDDTLKEAEAGALESDDPLKGTEPFTYTTGSGESRTLEGVLRVPGEGLLVPEDRVSSIEQLAQRADNLDRVTREYESQNAEYERLSRWVSQGPDGREQTFEGRDGLVQMRVQTGRLAAAFDTVVNVLRDPARLVSLLSIGEDGSVTANREALAHLLDASELAEMKAEGQIREHLRSLTSSTTAPQSSSGQASPASWAPQVIDAAAKSSGIDSKMLTAEDRSSLAALAPRFVRSATQEDRRLNPNLKIGSPIVDASFTQVVKERADLRASAMKQAATAERAGKFNAGQDKGRQPQKTLTTKAKPATQPAASQQTKRKADWDGPLTEFLQDAGIS